MLLPKEVLASSRADLQLQLEVMVSVKVENQFSGTVEMASAWVAMQNQKVETAYCLEEMPTLSEEAVLVLEATRSLEMVETAMVREETLTQQEATVFSLVRAMPTEELALESEEQLSSAMVVTALESEAMLPVIDDLLFVYLTKLLSLKSLI